MNKPTTAQSTGTGVLCGIALLLLVMGFGFIVSAQAAPPNIQVNTSTTKKFAGNKQNEPSLAQNPTDPLNLIAGANDQAAEPECTDSTPSTCIRPANISFSGFYASKDGGKTWECQGLIDLGPNAYAVGDPWQTFDSLGNAYYGTLAMPKDMAPFSAPADFYVAKSTDKGCSYSSAVKVSGNARSVFDDKDAIAADANDGSPFKDNVYAVWRPATGPQGLSNPIVFSCSTDGGKTWENPQHISAANAPDGTFRQGPSVQVGPDGTVYVIYFFANFQGFQGASAKSSIRLSISYDGGKTFPGKEIFVADITDEGTDPLPGTSFRDLARVIPSLTIAPDGKLYVAWSDYTNGHGVVMLTRSTNGGLSWSSPSVAANVTNRSAFFSALTADRDTKLNLVFQALDDVVTGTSARANAVFYDTYFTQSVDNGVTWITPQKITDVSSDPAGSSRESLAVQFLGDYISAVSDARGHHVFAVWTDTRNAVPCEAVDDFRIGVSSKPNVISQCNANFGNTDIFFADVPY